MKRVAIMQPYFLPYLGYFQLMAAVDVFVLFDNVQFIRRGHIHRNRIKVSGQAHRFTLSLERASQNRLIVDTCLEASPDRREKLLLTFANAYSKAPYFEQVQPLLETILRSEHRSLSLFLRHQFEVLVDYIGIDTELLLASECNWPLAEGREQRILSMVHSLGGTHYVNAWNGRDLYSANAFQPFGVSLSFHRMNDVCYRQGGGPFVPMLSIADVLMWNGPEETRLLLGACEFEASDGPHLGEM
jgi:hypothetical protein